MNVRSEWILGKVGHAEKDEDGNIISGNGFAFHNINISGCRQSLDGEYAIIPSNRVTATQKNSIKGDMNFMFLDDTTTPSVEGLTNSPEWKKEKEIL